MAANLMHSVGDEESQTLSSRRCSRNDDGAKGLSEEDGWTGKDDKPTFLLVQKLGLMDFVSLDVWRAAVAEVLGTAVLVFVLDTVVISTYETETKTPNLIMSILIAIFATIIILALLPVSGGHVNPIISFSAALVGIISMSRAIIYIVAQCIGAVLGALALKAVVSETIQENFSLGGCTIRAALGQVKVFTFVGIVFGLLVFISTTVTKQKGYGGAGLNPARCLGAALVKGGHLWDGLWVFWVAPAIACMAFYLYTKIIPREHFHADGYPHDLFPLSNVILSLYSINVNSDFKAVNHPHVEDGSNSVDAEARGSCTTELVETETGLPSNCSIIAPSTSVNSFLNSSSLTIFPSSASTIFNASLVILSICNKPEMSPAKLVPGEYQCQIPVPVPQCCSLPTKEDKPKQKLSSWDSLPFRIIGERHPNATTPGTKDASSTRSEPQTAAVLLPRKPESGLLGHHSTSKCSLFSAKAFSEASPWLPKSQPI
nr:X intrinsic protein [Ipomoea batatas]